MGKRLDKRRTKRFSLAWVQQLFSKHPQAVLGGVWLVLLLLGTVSARSIISPGEVSQEQPRAISAGVVEQHQPEPAPASTIAYIGEEPRSLPPLWLWGAIALGCATGSRLIFLSFRGKAKSRQPRKRVGASLKGGSPAAVRQASQRPPQKRRPLPKARQQPPVPTKPAFVTKPVRSAMPPESRQPPNGGKQNLAGKLDLRKRQSLDSLLRDCPSSAAKGNR